MQFRNAGALSQLPFILPDDFSHKKIGHYFEVRIPNGSFDELGLTYDVVARRESPVDALNFATQEAKLRVRQVYIMEVTVEHSTDTDPFNFGPAWTQTSERFVMLVRPEEDRQEQE